MQRSGTLAGFERAKKKYCGAIYQSKHFLFHISLHLAYLPEHHFAILSPFKKIFFVTVYDLQVLSLDEKGFSCVKSDICINIFVFLFVCFFAFGFCPCTLLHCLGTLFMSLELPRCTAPLHNGRPDFLVTCLALSCVGPVPVLCSQPLVCFVSQSQGSDSIILLCILARQLVSSTPTYRYHSRQPLCFL